MATVLYFLLLSASYPPGPRHLKQKGFTMHFIEILTGLLAYSAVFITTLVARTDYRKRMTYQNDWDSI